MTKKKPKMYKAKLSDFKTLGEANPNDGTERGQYMIETSIEKFGAWRSITATNDNVIPAGNHIAQAFGDKFADDDVLVIETTGEQLVVVKRTDIESTDPRTMEYAVVDNRVSEISLNWSPAELQRIADTSDIDLSKWFYDDELDEIMNVVPDFLPIDEDEQPRLDEKSPIRCPHCGVEFVPA